MNTPLLIHGITCLISRLYNKEVCNTAKKQNFFEVETDTKTRKEEEIKVVRQPKNGFKRNQTQHIWKEISQQRWCAQPSVVDV